MTLYVLVFLALSGWVGVALLAWACCAISARADRRAEQLWQQEQERKR